MELQKFGTNGNPRAISSACSNVYRGSFCKRFPHYGIALVHIINVPDLAIAKRFALEYRATILSTHRRNGFLCENTRTLCNGSDSRGIDFSAMRQIFSQNNRIRRRCESDFAHDPLTTGSMQRIEARYRKRFRQWALHKISSTGSQMLLVNSRLLSLEK